jgi:trk system potassium uptake protein TrkA
MYIVIAGGGIAGRNLTKKLVQNHDVIVIEKEQNVAEKIYSRYGAITILCFLQVKIPGFCKVFFAATQ